MWRYTAIKEHEINEQIRDREVRLLSQSGEMLGVMSSRAALEMAYEQDLDLVKISPGANPPVCRILDYNKFKYEQTRRMKDARKNQKTVDIKEIRTSVRVQDHDLQVKANNCSKFLKAGSKVKVSVRFRGREMAYMEDGKKLLLKFADMVSQDGVIDKAPKAEGRNYVMFLAPKTTQS